MPVAPTMAIFSDSMYIAPSQERYVYSDTNILSFLRLFVNKAANPGVPANRRLYFSLQRTEPPAPAMFLPSLPPVPLPEPWL